MMYPPPLLYATVIIRVHLIIRNSAYNMLIIGSNNYCCYNGMVLRENRTTLYVIQVRFYYNIIIAQVAVKITTTHTPRVSNIIVLLDRRSKNKR